MIPPITGSECLISGFDRGTRSVRRPYGCAATEFVFDHRAETVVTEGALLLDVGSDFSDVVGREHVIEQRAIGKLAFAGIGAEGAVRAMRLQERIVATQRVGEMAGPGEFGRMRDHRGPNGIEITGSEYLIRRKAL